MSYAIFAGFTALVGGFADGGDIWQRLLLILVHPLGAAGLLLLVLRPRLAAATILAVAALLAANVVADLRLAQLLAAGVVRGDWELAVAFSVAPAVGIVYALALLWLASPRADRGVTLWVQSDWRRDRRRSGCRNDNRQPEAVAR